MPPEPEAPPDWEIQASTDKASFAPPTPMDDMLSFEHYEPQADGNNKIAQEPAKFTPLPSAGAASSIPSITPLVNAPSLAPIAPPPMLDERKDDGLPARLITIFLRPSGDNERDRRRIKNVFLILISHPGKDRFQFQIFENGRGNMIDFPNDTTHISSYMLRRLKNLMGEETWRVDEITYQ